MDDDKLELVLVDDEERVSQALEREIRLAFKPAPFAIRSFSNPLEALDYVKGRKGSVFLVISDLRMPSMNGAELLTKIRAFDPEVETMLLTAYMDIEDIQRAVSSAIRSLLFKPWTRESVLAEIEKALESWTMKRENARLKSEIEQLLKTAGDFQRRIFASGLPAWAEGLVDVAWIPRDALHCGGDFWDALPVDESSCAFIVGDVAGHGPKSALVAAMLKALVAAEVGSDRSLPRQPDRLLSRLNERLCALLSATPEIFVAMTAAFVDTRARKMTLCVAGQPAVAIAGPSGLRRFSVSNPALGVSPVEEYWSRDVDLEAGDRVLAFTDGLVETRDGKDALPAELLDSLLSGKGSAEDIAKVVAAARSGGSFDDDATLFSFSIP
jgi:sigma-B regulation protein RsbU (phosphoserine phosphatase)